MTKTEAAKKGTKWWTDRLREISKQSTGDLLASFLVTQAEAEARKLTSSLEEKLSVFQSHLEANLLNMIEESDWREDNPMWGSGLRAVGVDYHPDLELAEAAEKAGISRLLFPVKTMMWLNPDGVKVSLGYHGKIEEVG